jgi:hypothetical protein
MQGPQINTLTKNDKVNVFMQKLQLCKGNRECIFLRVFYI